MKAAKKSAESPKKGVVVGDHAPKTVYAGEGSNVIKEAKERGATTRQSLDPVEAP